MRLKDDLVSRTWAHEQLKRALTHADASRQAMLADYEYIPDEGLVTVLCMNVFTPMSMNTYEKCCKEIVGSMKSKISKAPKGTYKSASEFEGYFNYCRDYTAMILLEHEIKNKLHREHDQVRDVYPTFDYSKITADSLLHAMPSEARKRIEYQMKQYL